MEKHDAHQTALLDKTQFGFWIYLMTDLILFATLFAVFIVMRGATAGGPTGAELFSLPFVLVETLFLLTSSYTCGLAMLAMHRGNKQQALTWLGITLAFGVAFLAMEIHEFANLVHEGASWKRSGFLSSFFTLVATHGLHITIGLLWLCVVAIKIYKKGFTTTNTRQLSLFSMFWHFLDIVWIFIFTIVYLMGAAIA
ncbi:MAG: cytochrome o ubiquinol oxidase subunit III [Candidatus Saccharimonadales bacterium]